MAVVDVARMRVRMMAMMMIEKAKEQPCHEFLRHHSVARNEMRMIGTRREDVTKKKKREAEERRNRQEGQQRRRTMKRRRMKRTMRRRRQR